ncbi:Sec-independent protein translocase TatCD [Virgibacillus sp. SK37]|nr:twin-arginine translocase subunit TatC [Virgibacillus sp. SK37]AIF44288.1 Sec-independent protein translocase TatCD [Virgibacillus sp. SK37]
MDPYEHHNREILSPLDKKKAANKEEKKQTEPSIKEKASSSAPEHNTNRISNDQTTNENEQTDQPTVVDHLTDLRKQIIKSLVVFSSIFIGVFSTINFWFPYVTKGHSLIILGPLEVVKFYMSISFVLALGISLPFLCHYIWQFVKPGLNEQENKFMNIYSPMMFLLFTFGIGFGYFVIHPLSYNFLISMGAKNFEVMVSAQEYMRFLMMTTMPVGLLFELPIVAMFLSAVGILTAHSMKKVRKWSYIILAVVSALITPPDFISQLLILVPMAILYEISIYMVTFMEKRAAAVPHS